METNVLPPKNARTRTSIHVDMTPMVDLGFLLISFFMLATTMVKPNVLDLSLPATQTGEVKNEIDRRNSITFLMGRDNRIFYHQNEAEALSANSLKEVDFSNASIARIIEEARNNSLKKDFFTVILKPTDEANYKNVVDMLDEMIITGSQRFGLADLNDEEKISYQQKISE